mmetsp:Transcript_34460/g.97646  ORF Transcript_34460/g.97646 Transcript_34460/m.97646 type:complete len:95 (-) Transcript_34460:201-485(-)
MEVDDEDLLGYGGEECPPTTEPLAGRRESTTNVDPDGTGKEAATKDSNIVGGAPQTGKKSRRTILEVVLQHQVILVHKGSARVASSMSALMHEQ